MKNPNPSKRYKDGIPHDPRSVELYKKLADFDYKCGDWFCFKSGGDGDNGEHLMYLLDMYFTEKDAYAVRDHGGE